MKLNREQVYLVIVLITMFTGYLQGGFEGLKFIIASFSLSGLFIIGLYCFDFIKEYQTKNLILK